MKNLLFSLLITALLINPVFADEYVERDYGSIGTGISTSTPSTQAETEEAREEINGDQLSQSARNFALDSKESNTAAIAIAVIIILAIAAGIFVAQRNRYA